MRQKRLVYLTAEGATLHSWDANRCTVSARFSPDEKGKKEFAEAFNENPGITTYVLVDLIDEEYKLGHVPHVIGKDRETVLKRHSERLFRNTPYRYTEIQDREQQGRRDDNVLCAAVTNTELLTPWLKILDQQQVALTGVYSLPLLSQTLLRVLKVTSPNVLIVTLLSSGLRLSFLANGKLKLSRLAPFRLDQAEVSANIVLDEIEKTERYLGRLRMLSRDAAMVVQLVGSESLMAALQHSSSSLENKRAVLVDVSSVLNDLGVEIKNDASTCDSLFSHLLVKKPPPNHFAPKEFLRFGEMYRLSRSLKTASVVLFIGTLMGSAFNVVEAFNYETKKANALTETTQFNSRSIEIEDMLPTTPVESEDLRDMALKAEKLVEMRTSPLPFAVNVSRIFDAFDNVELSRISWKTVTPEDAQRELELAVDADPSAIEEEFYDDEGNFKVKQVATLVARITPFNGEYVKAFEVLDRFIEALHEEGSFSSVKLLKAPINVRPDAQIAGEAGFNANTRVDAEFSVELTTETTYESQ